MLRQPLGRHCTHVKCRCESDYWESRIALQAIVTSVVTASLADVGVAFPQVYVYPQARHLRALRGGQVQSLLKAVGKHRRV